MKKEIYIDDEVDRRLHRELAVEATVNLYKEREVLHRREQRFHT